MENTSPEISIVVEPPRSESKNLLDLFITSGLEILPLIMAIGISLIFKSNRHH
ncbi:MAG: hypothetical protein ACXAEU_13660 [Candidatus Hodarchaeales archaeon]